MGIFDEPERGRTKVSRARSRVQTTRRSWPVSARLLIGAMFVLNILLAVFLVRTEIKRPGAAATSTPLPLERPKVGSSPQLNPPPNQGSSPDRGSSLVQESSHAANTPPVEVRPAGLPSTRMSKRYPIKALPKALRASKTQPLLLLPPMPRAVIHPSPEPLGQSSAPVRDSAASSGAADNVAPPRLAASVSIPGSGARGNAAPPPRAPAASTLAPSAAGNGLTAKGARSGSVAKVASVGLPAMEKVFFIPKMPVASVSPKMEIVPRPAVKLENCGDDKVFIACPTLKIRYDTPYTSEDP